MTRDASTSHVCCRSAADQYLRRPRLAAAPSGWWIYIMTREKVVGDAALAPHLEFLKSKGVNLSKVTRFNQGQ